MKGIAVAAAALAVAAVPAASASPRLDQPLTLHLASVQTQFVPLTSGPNAAPRVGDRMIFGQVLYNRGAQLGRPDGARVGTAENVCTVVPGRRLQCVLAAHLPNGDVFLTGSVAAGSKANRFGVTGGVGAYAGARGEATGRDVSETRSRVALRLR
jgi:hypothetical protein